MWRRRSPNLISASRSYTPRWSPTPGFAIGCLPSSKPSSIAAAEAFWPLPDRPNCCRITRYSPARFACAILTWILLASSRSTCCGANVQVTIPTPSTVLFPQPSTGSPLAYAIPVEEGITLVGLQSLRDGIPKLSPQRRTLVYCIFNSPKKHPKQVNADGTQSWDARLHHPRKHTVIGSRA